MRCLCCAKAGYPSKASSAHHNEYLNKGEVMAIFGISREDFDSFQSTILSRLTNIESEVRQRPEEHEQQARTSAANAAALEAQVRSNAGAVQSALNELNQYKVEALKELEALQAEKARVAARSEELTQQINASQNAYSQFTEAKSIVDEKIADIAQKVNQSKVLLDQSAALPVVLEDAQGLLSESKSLAESIRAVLAHATTRKSEIDELHKRILGQDIPGEDGKAEHIDGLKDELEKSYRALNDQSHNLATSIELLTSSICSKHDKLLDERNTKFEELLSKSTARYESVNGQLNGLLPGAMAEGLSAAYEKKKDEESKALASFEKSFSKAIAALVCISAIPIAVDIYLLAFQDKTLVQVIQDTPKLMAAILPLYFPVLWLAYSTNKKLNLSKRLIEEYTHKSVLGKTFSGLSNQIETLPHQSAVKEELRVRLLFNVLQVSAENPGKLITDYNKADHPIMDVLENSGRLSDSMDALAKIPGFSSVAKKLFERSERMISAQVEKVEKGLLDQVAINSLEVSDSNKEPSKA